MKQKFQTMKLKVPFDGELMTCYVCEKTKLSKKGEESGWTALTFEDGLRLYFCPKCFSQALKMQRKI